MLLAARQSMTRDKTPSDAEVEAEAAAIYPDTNAGPPTPEQIAEEAHAIYLNRGADHGHDIDDWLAAERRLRANAGARGLDPSEERDREANRLAHGSDDLKA
jgi:hypothetical protein